MQKNKAFDKISRILPDTEHKITRKNKVVDSEPYGEFVVVVFFVGNTAYTLDLRSFPHSPF